MISGDEIYPTLLLSKFIFPDYMHLDCLEQVDECIYITRNHISAYGIKFPLFDVRRFNSSIFIAYSYDISYEFLKRNNPLLNGRIVRINSVNPEHPLYKTCTKVATMPGLNFRYTYERWTENLRVWTKLFFISTLDILIGTTANPIFWDYLKKI